MTVPPSSRTFANARLSSRRSSRRTAPKGRKHPSPPAMTMRLAQQLYEGIDVGSEGRVGLITYMRTDSTRISKDAQDACRRFIKQRFGDKYLPDQPPTYTSGKGAQEAHEAIRPTD